MLAIFYMLKHSTKFIAVVFGLVLAINPLSAHAFAWADLVPTILMASAREPEQFKSALPMAKYNEPRRTVKRAVTAYSSTPDQCDDTPFITANGTYVHDGIVAANWLKFGTRVRLPEVFGDKVFVVADRMHPRFDDRLDVWMETREQAIDFGFQQLTVEVL